MVALSWVRQISVILLFLNINQALAWNALGHRLIAQIAYDYLTPHARSTFNDYNQYLNQVYQSRDLVDASVWLDTLRSHDVHWFNHLHYIECFFSKDNTPLPEAHSMNAVWAIRQAQHALAGIKANGFDKGIHLRILLHVTGDLHQPLHAASRVSKAFPGGDKGGNLCLLGANPIAENLHLYWDKGAGFLVRKNQTSRKEILKMADDIVSHYPCYPELMDLDPSHWAQDSHTIAINHVYKIKADQVPNKYYQKQAQNIVKQQIALAGCRLAAILNKIDSNQAVSKAFMTAPKNRVASPPVTAL